MEDEISRLSNDKISLAKKVKSLEEDNERLKEEVKSALSLKSKVFTEYYKGEVDYVVLRALHYSKKSLTGAGCNRQTDILNDVITNMENHSSAMVGKDHVKKMKQLQRGDIDKTLEAMGFEKKRVNKHNIYQWHGDSRYQETLSATPSDKRYYQNMLHDTWKKIFGIEQ